jgi:hypothetical protein
MEKYQRGKVYAIICLKTGRRYVGSTCEPTLAKRLAQHVRDNKQCLKGKTKFCSSYNIIRDGEYYIILLESYPCNSKDELRMCEQKHIDSCECENKCCAYSGLTSEQYNKKYREEHIDEIKQQREQYREKNYQKITDLHKSCNIDTCCPNCQKNMKKYSLKRHLKICPQLKNEIETDVI